MGAVAIPLQVQPAQIASPLQTIGSLMQLKEGLARQALTAAQAQQANEEAATLRAQAEQRNRDLADENTIQSAQQNPDMASKFGQGDFSALAGKVQPKALQGLATQYQDLVTKRATAAKADLELNASKHAQIADALAGMKQLAADSESPEEGLAKVQAEYPNAVARMVGDKILNQGTFPSSITSLDDLDKLAAANNVYSGVNAKALATKAEQQKIATAAAQESEAKAGESLKAAQLAGETAKSTREQLITAAMQKAQNAPASGVHPIDAILGKVDPAAAAAYKVDYDNAKQNDLSGGDVKLTQAQGVLTRAAEHAATLSQANIDNAAKKAVAVEQATTPAKINQAVQTEVQKARLAGGIGQIIDPQQRNEASRTLDAADKEAIDKISAADSLKNTVQMAQAGNKVAPNLETIEELRSIVNRVNGKELQAVGSAGNAYDRAKGFLGKWVTGQPIPDNIQNDFLQVADAQQKVAQQKHAASYGTVAARFGVKDLTPPDIAGIYSQAKGNTSAPANGPKKIANAADYNALPSGATYIDPNGVTRTKK